MTNLKNNVFPYILGIGVIFAITTMIWTHNVNAQTCSFDFTTNLCTCPPQLPFLSDYLTCMESSDSSGRSPGGSGGSSGRSPGGSGGSVVLEPPIPYADDPRMIIGNVIKVVLGIVGSLALIIFIYGGLMWMTSSGNTERIKKGRDTLVWAAIGLMVIFGSYTVINFVIQSITKP